MFNLTNGRGYTVADVTRSTSDWMARKSRGTRAEFGDRPAPISDSSRARQLLGLKPNIGFVTKYQFSVRRRIQALVSPVPAGRT